MTGDKHEPHSVLNVVYVLLCIENGISDVKIIAMKK